MKQRTANSITAFIAGMLAFTCFYMLFNEAAASKTDLPPQPPTQGQVQQQHQGQDQTQDQTQSMGDQANSQSISFSTPDDIKIKRTPNVYAPSIDPSHPCALTWSAGASVTGIGLSGGKAYVDAACNAREWARLMFQMGARDAALAVMCSQPEGADVPDCAGVRDYNKEMKLLQFGHDQLVEDNTELRDRIEFLLSERIEDQEQCKESVNRVGDELERCLKK